MRPLGRWTQRRTRSTPLRATGVVIMLMWLYVSAYVVTLGAELDSELESHRSRASNAAPPPKILYSK